MAVWLVAAVVVGVLVGRMIRQRDRQQPREPGRTPARTRGGPAAHPGPAGRSSRKQRVTGRGRQHRL